MTPVLTDDQVRRLRARSQLLTRDAERAVADIARATGGLQAQDMHAMALAVRARGAGLTAADIERARVEERSVTRTWCMRGTLHLVATDDLGWLGALLFPRLLAATRPRRLALGLSDDICARGVDAIRAILGARGPQTRHELRPCLAERGIEVAGQALVYLIYLAALHGVVCDGPARGREPTYVPRDDWLGPLDGLPHDAALAEIARRHLRAFGPARPEDLAAWSGLPISQARAGWRAIERELLEVEVGGRPAWLLQERAGWLDEPPAQAPLVTLLPAFDTYLMGYRGRDLAVPAEHARRVVPGGGILRPTLLVDGAARGIWSIARRRASVEVRVEPFAELPGDVLAGLADEAADVGLFVGAQVTLTVSDIP